MHSGVAAHRYFSSATYEFFVFDVATAASIKVASPSGEDAQPTSAVAWVYFSRQERYALLTASLQKKVTLWHLDGDCKVRSRLMPHFFESCSVAW